MAAMRKLPLIYADIRCSIEIRFFSASSSLDRNQNFKTETRQ